MIKHIVLFSFKPDVSQKIIEEADNLFKALPRLINEIQDFEAGINISPENLNKGFTHAYCLSFSAEGTRDVYLEHKDHKVFSGYVGDLLEDVLVIDYEI